MNVCVYCGSSLPKNEKFILEAKKLAELIGKSKNTLVFGGSDCGIMKIIAENSKAFGAKIISVQLDLFHKEKGHTISYSDELFVTKNFQERKAKMLQISDIFIVFPGGTGTLDEFTDTLISTEFFYKNKEIYLLNIDNFYDNLVKMLEKMIEENFLREEVLKRIKIVNSVEKIALN